MAPAPRRPRRAAPLLPLLLLAAAAAPPRAARAAVGLSQTSAAAPAESLCAKKPFASAGLPSAMTRGGNLVKVYHNLYLHNSKWYALLPPGANHSEVDKGMSMNYNVETLPAADVEAFQSNLKKICYVPGNTLHVDFPFPGYPDNLGHWGEIMWPTFSALSTPGSNWAAALRRPAGGKGGSEAEAEAEGGAEAAGAGGKSKRPAGRLQRVLLANISARMLDWFRETLLLAVSRALPKGSPPGALPPLVEESAAEGYSQTRWILFERLVVVQDRYPLLHALRREPWLEATRATADGSDPLVQNTYKTGFSTPAAAAAFRAAAHARHGWPLRGGGGGGGECGGDAARECGAGGGSGGGGGGGGGLPRVVTVMLDPDHYPAITNHRALVEKLEDITGPMGFKVRVTSLTMEAPFVSHLATMAETGLLVARHGPILSSAVLLPPGAAVLELLPYKWDWRNMSSLYFNMTQSTGAIHHYAWKPTDDKWCKYKSPAERALYSSWTGDECNKRACLEVHAAAGLEVDLEAVEQLLRRKLPGVLRGEPVDSLREPWPQSD